MSNIYFGEPPESLDDGWETPNHTNSYCKHGEYVGNPHGRDFICGECEEEEYDTE